MRRERERARERERERESIVIIIINRIDFPLPLSPPPSLTPGPVVPDGFGIGYIIKDQCMHFHITRHAADRCSSIALVESVHVSVL